MAYYLNLLGSHSSELSTASVAARIIISLIISAIIGYERSSKRHSAGLRTFIVVSLASTTAAIIEDYLLRAGYISGWIIPAVIISVAIISCPSIFFSSKGQLRGLTTSASLWACCILGIAVGMGLYVLALLSFIALLCTLTLFATLESYMRNKSNHFEVHLELRSKNDLESFSATIRRLGMRIDDIELNPAYLNSGMSVYTVAFTISSEELRKYKKHSEIIEALSTLDYISFIEEIG